MEKKNRNIYDYESIVDILAEMVTTYLEKNTQGEN